MKLKTSIYVFIATVYELIRGLLNNGYWWLIPLVFILLPISLGFIIVQAVPIVAPFVYTLF